jgi:hypothetical protein
MILQKVVLLSVVFSSILFLWEPSVAQVPKVNVVFCGFEPSKSLVQGHANFTLRVLFLIDQKGKPANPRQVGGFRVDQNQVKKCLSEWDFSGLSANSRVTARFTWKHGIGWTQMDVSGRELNVKITRPK